MGYYFQDEKDDGSPLLQGDLMRLRFKELYASALKKDQIEDLTNDEVCAIGVFAGVPWTTEWQGEQMKITFTVAFGVHHDGLRWQVLQAPE